MNPSDFVNVTGDQTISGTKTFADSPVVPNKTTAATNSGTKIATEYQVRSGDQLLSGRIAELSGNTIRINPTSENSGQYCYSTDGNTLVCNNDLSGAVINIFTGTLMTGIDTRLCVKSGDMIDCNIDPSRLGSGTTIEGTSGHRCTYVCDKEEDGECTLGHIECYERAPSCEGDCTGGSGITVSGVTLGGYCRYVTQELIESFGKALNFNLQDLKDMPTEGGRIECTFGGGTSQSITISGSDTSLCCRYTSPTEITCDQNCGGGSGETNNYNFYTITGGNTTIQSGANVTIISGGSSDGLREQGKDSNGKDVLTPTKNIHRLYLTSPSSYDPAVIRHGGYLRIQKSGLNMAYSPVEFNSKGAKFGDVSIARDFRTSDSSYAGVSIAGQLIVGNTNSDNYIYMYASGTAGGQNSHYEIKATQELAIGIDSGAFLYFQSYTGNTSGNNYRNMRIGVNNNTPRATLDIRGSIRVSDEGGCFPPCNSASAGSIIYRKATDKFYGCKDDGKRHEFTMGTDGIDANGINGCTEVIVPTSNPVL